MKNIFLEFFEIEVLVNDWYLIWDISIEGYKFVIFWYRGDSYNLLIEFLCFNYIMKKILNEV